MSRRLLTTLPLALLLGLGALAAPDAEGGEAEAEQQGERGGRAEGLLAVYREARDADPQLRGRHAELAALLDDRREAFGGLLPSLSASADISRIERDQLQTSFGGEEDITRRYTQQQYQVNAEQPLFDLPAWHRWQAGAEQVDAGEADLEARRQGLIHDTAKAYLEVLGARSKVTLKQRELKQIRGQRERIAALHEAGEASTSEFQEVHARFDQVRAELLRARGEVETARQQLTALTGERHERLAGLRPDAELPPLEPQDPQQWVEHAVTGNPEVVAARERTAAEGRKARAAQAERYPKVSLTGGFTRYDDFDGTRFGREIEDWSVGVQVRMPFYEGGAMRARARSAEHRQSRQAEELERARREARKEVRSAYEGLVSGRSEIEAFRLAVRSAERSLEAIRDEVETGTRPLTDLLEAQSKRFEARHSLAEARHQYLIDTLALRRAAGHLGAEDVRALDALLSPGATATEAQQSR